MKSSLAISMKQLTGLVFVFSHLRVFAILRHPVLLSVLRVSVVFPLAFCVAAATKAEAPARDYRFDGTISREVLENYLSRSITMEGMLNGRGDLDDNIRMLKHMGAKFIGRSLCLWGGEGNLLRNLDRAKQLVPKVYAADPEIILQACIFEIVTPQVDQVPVPDWAFTALGRPVEQRNFRYADMLYPDGRFKNHWGRSSVPDVSQPETKLWFYFLAASFIDAGFEAIHLGQTELMNKNDRNLEHYAQVLALMRSYAAKHARRHMLICDSHVPSGGLVRDGKLLMDFHSFPLRIMEVPDKPQEAILKVGFSDGIYGRSKGGVTPSGWTCEHLPFLAEIDNFGVSRQPGQAKAGGIWIWGYDEITWFAHQTEQQRNDWLRYAWDWVRKTDPNGFLQMPGSRTMTSPLDRKRWYYANNPSPAVPEGYGQEEAIRAIWASDAATKPIALHPENPHYLLFRGKPTVLITSTEHYGAVLNLDFDYVPYLEELKRCGLNLTRAFSGVYCEDVRSFNIKGNPLAPRRDRLICPFARSGVAGYANGGNKFDLTKWDEAYFRRLKDFVAQAGKRGIVVELVLFCPFYEDEMWKLSPMKVDNNVNGVGTMPRNEVYTLRHPKMLAIHESVTRKIVEELKDADNVYFEICNEPYFGGVTLEWQAKIAAAITEAEKALPHKHLIAQNIANGKQKIEGANPAVSIFNFHYATPPDTVGMNFGLNRVIADDETGFKGPGDAVYRGEGWDFLLAGGAIYDNLDYSFTPEHSDGTAVPDAPGGGGRALRMQLKTLREFIERFDFVKMSPDDAAVRGREGLPSKVTARALVEKGKQYAIYIRGDGAKAIKLDLPAGKYAVEMIHPKLDKPATPEARQHSGGEFSLPLPAYSEDLAVGVRRIGD